MIKTDEKPDLLRHELHRVEFVSLADLDKIVEDNEATVLDNVDLGQAHIILNDILRRTLSRQMAKRITKVQRDKLNRLAGSLASYVTELRQFEPIPPAYLGLFLDDLKKWNEELEQAPPKGRSRQAMTSDFLPEALGLFWAIFDEDPTASVKYDANGDENYSPVAQFVNAIMQEMTNFFAENEVVKRQPEFGKIEAAWKPRTLEGLEKWISDGKNSGVVLFHPQLGHHIFGYTSERIDGDTEPAWKLHAALFGDEIRPQKRPVN